MVPFFYYLQETYIHAVFTIRNAAKVGSIELKYE